MAISREFPSSRLRPFGSSPSDYICLDLLLLILKWFPVQTLLICRSVCKSWKEIIDSTPFILDHLAHQRPRVLLQKHRFEYHLLDPDYHPIYDTISSPDGIYLGSPKHLLAVGTIHGVICLYDNGNYLFLWNPSIHRHMRIPLPPSEFTASSKNEHDWTKYCGFWMDSRTKEFKVVIFYIAIEGEKGGSLFSSTDQKWLEIPKKEMVVFNDYYQSNNPSPHFLLNGVAHWIATDYQDYYGGLIVYYDFGRDKFGKIVLPEGVRGWSDIRFSKWDDCLSIVATAYPWHPIGYVVWAMRGGLWSKVGQLSPTEGLRGIFAVLDWMNVLASNRDGELVLYREHDDILIPVFSRNDSDIHLKLNHGDSYLFSFSFDFVESLIFPY